MPAPRPALDRQDPRNTAPLTLALLFGLFSLICGVSQIVMGSELRRSGKTLDSVLQDAA